MLLIREARTSDFSGVFRLARLLDSYNLPADPGTIRNLLRLSERSFAGKVSKTQAKYLFLLEDRERSSRKIIGCSLIIAKHGTPGRPHIWLRLQSQRLTSRTLGKSRSHVVLRLGYTEDGPTEVGGFIVLPAWRHRAQRCGLQLSYVRFLYMAMHPNRFENQVLVEYRGVLGKGGRSPFWEAMGKVFTGLPYRKADRLSVTNKEFILSLWPREPIYCALLPKTVQRSIGAVHPSAARAARLLERIGFVPLPEVEPFDGGPYYLAQRRRIRLIQKTERLQAVFGKQPRRRHLIATDRGGRFRAVLAPSDIQKRKLSIRREEAALLGVKKGDRVYACPISG